MLGAFRGRRPCEGCSLAGLIQTLQPLHLEAKLRQFTTCLLGGTQWQHGLDIDISSAHFTTSSGLSHRLSVSRRVGSGAINASFVLNLGLAKGADQGRVPRINRGTVAKGSRKPPRQCLHIRHSTRRLSCSSVSMLSGSSSNGVMRGAGSSGHTALPRFAAGVDLPSSLSAV